MKALREKLAIQENMGVIDRSMRVLAGSLLTVPIIVAMANVDPIGWQLYATLFAFYLLLTGMMGWDPLYAILHGHTCLRAQPLRQLHLRDESGHGPSPRSRSGI